MTTLVEVPDYYSEEYHYRRYPAKVGGRAGKFCVWSRDVERPNPNHVTWDPEIVALVSEDYRTPAWHAERQEQRDRTEVLPGDHVTLGDVTIVVPKRATQYISHVPCEEVQ